MNKPILLFGGKGSGKSTISRAIANQYNSERVTLTRYESLLIELHKINDNGLGEFLSVMNQRLIIVEATPSISAVGLMVPVLKNFRFIRFVFEIQSEVNSEIDYIKSVSNELSLIDLTGKCQSFT